jgi:hypothetical protein
MNKKVRNIGLMALAAGLLYYPAMRLYKSWAARKMDTDDLGDEHEAKHFAHLHAEPRAHNRKPTNRQPKVKNLA